MTRHGGATVLHHLLLVMLPALFLFSGINRYVKQSKKVNQNNWVDNRKCKWFFQMDFTKSKTCSFENWVSRNKVRVPKIQATLVLRCSNAPDLKADSKSVRIFEISQQMPKIPTFFPKRREKSRKFFEVSWFRCHIVRIQGKKNEEI